MSSRKLTELTCDKCGVSAVMGSHEPDLADWGKLLAASHAGKDIVGTLEKPIDLCPSCLDGLLQWYRPTVLSK